MTRLKITQTENDVKALVKKWYDARGAWSYAPIQTGMGEHGIPDRIGCLPIMVTPSMVGTKVGLFVAVESKRPGRRGEINAGASPAQMNQLREIIEAAGLGIIADGTNDLDILTEMTATPPPPPSIVLQILRRRTGNG